MTQSSTTTTAGGTMAIAARVHASRRILNAGLQDIPVLTQVLLSCFVRTLPCRTGTAFRIIHERCVAVL